MGQQSDLQRCPECITCGHGKEFSPYGKCLFVFVSDNSRVCECRCTFPVSTTEAATKKELDEVLRQAQIDDPIGVTLALFSAARMAIRMESECDLREQVATTEAGEGQDSNNAAQNSGGVGDESPRPTSQGSIPCPHDAGLCVACGVLLCDYSDCLAHNQHLKDVHQQQTINSFNDLHPVGSTVIVTLDDWGEFEATVKYPAAVVGHAVKVWLDGLSGAYSLNRVRATRDSHDVPERETETTTQG